MRENNGRLEEQTLPRGVKRVLISEERLREAVMRAGREITRAYRGQPLLLVGILKGSFVFLSDLCRAIDLPLQVGFMAAKSYYDGTTSSGSVRITLDLAIELSSFHVILVEDIVDTGRTLADVAALLRSRTPLSLRVLTLLDKPSRRTLDFTPDGALFTIPDLFVVGYGLDCGELYRNLPYIAEYDEAAGA